MVRSSAILFGKKLIVLWIILGILLPGDRPTVAQVIPPFGLADGDFMAHPYVPTFTSGNLEFAPVFLDGKVVGTVSARTANNPRDGENYNNFDAAKRSYLIHNKAQRILDNMSTYAQQVLREQGITHPVAQVRALKEQLAIEVTNRNNTIAVVATFPQGSVPEVLYSVTQAEIERSRIVSSQPEKIAQRVADIINKALITAWQERQLPHLLAQAERALLVFVALGGTSFALFWAQKFLSIKRQQLDQYYENSVPSFAAEGGEATVTRLGKWGLGRITQQLHKLPLRQHKSFNALCQSVLFWSQWLIWLLGMGYIGSLFYFSRPFSNWIIGISIRGVIPGETFPFRWPPMDWLISFGQEATLGSPLLILLLLLITRITIKGGDVLTDFWVERWSRQQSTQRRSLRGPTLAMAFKGWLRVIVYLVLGVVAAHHLQKLGTITQAVAVILGVLSFAISLASQNLLKDLIAGLLILWEDQYAVGDVIVVGDQGGLVERLTLRITQLRNLDGELITIPNGTIEMVKNLSSEWSRVNYAVEVNYDADVEKVMAVMAAIANEMYEEPEWQPQILEPPEILGVDNIAHTGILIRLLIKTQPLQQWPVAREYRLRLKNAFDQAGISVGIPRQNVYLNETLLPNGHLNPEGV